MEEGQGGQQKSQQTSRQVMPAFSRCDESSRVRGPGTLALCCKLALLRAAGILAPPTTSLPIPSNCYPRRKALSCRYISPQSKLIYNIGRWPSLGITHPTILLSSSTSNPVSWQCRRYYLQLFISTSCVNDVESLMSRLDRPSMRRQSMCPLFCLLSSATVILSMRDLDFPPHFRSLQKQNRPQLSLEK